MEPFKNRYNLKVLKSFSKIIKHEKFDDKKFLKSLSIEIDSLEMKERVDLVSKELYNHFNLSYEKKLKFINSKLDEIKELEPFLIWPLTNYVALYGLDDLKNSSSAMKEMTKRFSSEFVIRYFLEKYEDQMYKYILTWSKDQNEHVRRLSSEGTRPNLPWGIKVDYINNNLKQNINLLDSLKDDDSLYVRKSVANHLNDITHINPKLVIDLLSKWNKNDKKHRWIIKQATRTLLKKGNSSALKLNGFSINPKVELLDAKISNKKIKEGDRFEISFKLNSLIKKDQKLSVDYIIYYPKKNGKISPKVFKLKDFILKDSNFLKKEIHFKKVTTRVHYKGIHKIEIKVNDKNFNLGEFELV